MHSMISCVVMVGTLAVAFCQQMGKEQEETHLEFGMQECTKDAGCADQPGSVVLDMQWRWLHDKDGYTNCLGDKEWDPSLCPDPEGCSRKCALEGVSRDDHSQVYGIDPVDGGVKLSYVAPKGNVASRVYLLESDEKYRMFKLKNREFSVTVDVSSLPCGLNGAIYFVEMPEDGGKDGDLNSAGAKYGTGYCDAQCPRGMKFVDGIADVEGFGMIEVRTPELETKEVGPVGKYGSCCAEMDIFEANSKAASYTAHPCAFTGTKRCKGEEECGNKAKGYMSECDKDGCGMNSYQLGDREFFGKGKQVDSSKPVTLITQFLTSDNTDTGDLVEIRRLFIQDGQVIKNTRAKNIPNQPDSITDEMCDDMAEAFNDTKSFTFAKNGGLKSMGDALQRGMVLTMSIWDDSLSRMLWLDGVKNQIDKDEAFPGVSRGPCPFESGVAKALHTEAKMASVTFTDVKVGEIGSTFQESPAKLYVIDDASKKPFLAQPLARLPLAATVAAFVAVSMTALIYAVTVRSNRWRQQSPAVRLDEGME